jgi:hypothetical protein
MEILSSTCSNSNFANRNNPSFLSLFSLVHSMLYRSHLATNEVQHESAVYITGGSCLSMSLDPTAERVSWHVGHNCPIPPLVCYRLVGIPSSSTCKCMMHRSCDSSAMRIEYPQQFPWSPLVLTVGREVQWPEAM